MKKVISVSIAEELHEKAKRDAEKNGGMSLSAYISMLIAKQK